MGGLTKYKDVSSSEYDEIQNGRQNVPLFQVEKCKQINEQTGKMEWLERSIIL